MKKIKKILTAFLILAISMGIVACSGGNKKVLKVANEEELKKEEEKTVKTFSKDFDTKSFIVEYKGDVVNKITMKSVLSFEKLKIKNEKDANAVIAKQKQVFATLGDSAKSEVKIENKNLVMTIVVDVSKLDVNKFNKSGILGGTLDANNFKSLKAFENNLIQNGYVEKK
ncbi:MULTISPECIES: DUF1307 domain-containing protein [unclassified Parvimonas]|uniref:DUF1307 domain-containing protein n=1 Tax=unclassified Parvimonas TaxID=1151464 RepID=UPI002B4A64C1|nr:MULTISPECIES: DUF1307 domain-containing protein [unclassified Parvimonas]MEB3025498.1 DUF1307 domain-containing protein [Parvimonas sp. M13]MEB3089629.1 DUF1307 domain-containing protein [Parvimonas sp. M20]